MLGVRRRLGGRLLQDLHHPPLDAAAVEASHGPEDLVRLALGQIGPEEPFADRRRAVGLDVLLQGMFLLHRREIRPFLQQLLDLPGGFLVLAPDLIDLQHGAGRKPLGVLVELLFRLLERGLLDDLQLLVLDFVEQPLVFEHPDVAANLGVLVIPARPRLGGKDRGPQRHIQQLLNALGRVQIVRSARRDDVAQRPKPVLESELPAFERGQGQVLLLLGQLRANLAIANPVFARPPRLPRLGQEPLMNLRGLGEVLAHFRELAFLGHLAVELLHDPGRPGPLDEHLRLLPGGLRVVLHHLVDLRFLDRQLALELGLQQFPDQQLLLQLQDGGVNLLILEIPEPAALQAHRLLGQHRAEDGFRRHRLGLPVELLLLRPDLLQKPADQLVPRDRGSADLRHDGRALRIGVRHRTRNLRRRLRRIGPGHDRCDAQKAEHGHDAGRTHGSDSSFH